MPFDIVPVCRFVSYPGSDLGVSQPIFDHIPRKSNALFGIHHVHAPIAISRTLGKRSGHGIHHRRRSLFTGFRGNHNHAICGFFPVNSRSRRILQHVDLFDILRVQTGNSVTQQIHEIQIIQILRIHVHRVFLDHTVDHPKRFL